MMRLVSRTSARLAELIAALSLAADLGTGQPMEHVLRSCLIATRMAERLGLDDVERAELYYVALLAWVGCTADASETAAWFGDDIEFHAQMYHKDETGVPMLWFLLRQAGAGSPPWRRVRLAAAVVGTRGRALQQSMSAHCQVTGLLAERLGLVPEVRQSLQQVFARWDGKGLPTGLGGEGIARSVRLMHLADVVEAFHREHGLEASIDSVRARRGTLLDPFLVDEFVAMAPELLATIGAESHWDDLIEAEPVLRAPLSDAELDTALEAIADFTDLKSPYFAGHSRGVADLSELAARHAGLPGLDVISVRRAGLVHDLGRSAVPNSIWDKPGPLTLTEWERVRLHPYYTERILARVQALAGPAAIAATHHERLDGSGYHRGLTGDSVGVEGRVLAAADAYHAMTEPRPYRPALSAEEAAAALRAEVRAGRLDMSAADAVLHAAGHRTRRRSTAAAGLTPRELEVFSLLARGASNREIARLLSISVKTVGNHVEHIYAKTGVSTRAAATLFAMRHGMLQSFEPLER
jgi:HD-GYP domain-containing protein (c-di-GMP phosphodiesterase class II)